MLTLWTIMSRGEGEHALIDIPQQADAAGVNNDNYVQRNLGRHCVSQL